VVQKSKIIATSNSQWVLNLPFSLLTKFEGSVELFIYDSMIKFILFQLSFIPKMKKIWIKNCEAEKTKEEEDEDEEQQQHQEEEETNYSKIFIVDENSLPNFAEQPSNYITQIGEQLLTLKVRLKTFGNEHSNIKYKKVVLSYKRDTGKKNNLKDVV